MEIIIIVVLIIIISIMLCYLFLINKELKKIEKQIDFLEDINTNNLIHSQYNFKNINNIIQKINNLIKKSKNKQLEFDKKNKELMKMMTNISHDLRTPLTSALGYINLILNSDISEEEKEKELKIIEERLQRLEELINSFFEFSKIVSNNESPELEKVNLISVLQECIVHYYEDYVKQNRKIILDCKESKLILNSNKLLLIRIFDNLIGNAYKHSNSDLEIKVFMSKENSRVKLIFTNKLFYDDLDMDKMFDEFYTIDISRTKGNTGLGLAISKEFTEQLNGEIYAKKDKDNLNIIIEF